MLQKRKRFKTGEIIFAEGDPGDSAFIIESGQVEMFVGPPDDSVCIMTFGIGEIFGEMSVIDGSTRTSSARATEPCELIIVSAEALAERIEDADPIVRFLVTMLLKRMRSVGKNTSNSALLDVDGNNQSRLLTVSGLTGEGEKERTLKVIEKMRIESELKQALHADEFALHYQPIIDLRFGSIAGYEALIRWSSPERGLVRPDIFMGIAEETSLIVPIGRWVIERACRDLKTFLDRMKELNSNEEPDLFVSINISGKQFLDGNFFSHLTESVKASGVRNSQVKLEVTERIFMEGPNALHSIKRCRELGFHVSLDDFGTGYSSLSYLAQFQVDSIKVDQSFVKRMLADPKTFVITQAIIAMANGLDIPVIAEGIENEEEFYTLGEDMLCRYGQGYWFSRPTPLADALSLLGHPLPVKKVS
ncbi:MAG: EAL domain-containing protein [Pseudobacteriovorax sp.]|nr:EAL domain-containing protein [Pseudobacteriovorax sp.]